MLIVKRGVSGNEPVGVITERDIIRKIGEADLFTTQSYYHIPYVPHTDQTSKNLLNI